MTTISITISGIPIAKKRPKFTTKGGHPHAVNVQITEEGRYLLECKSLLSGYSEILPIQKPSGVAVNCIFNMPIPKSQSKKKRDMMLSGELLHTKKPDIDNLKKFVLDCLNGITWEDDSQVVFSSGEKRYSENPSTEIRITAL